MARPNKQGLDYFPMDVTTDDKFELIEAKHGVVGFAVIIKLFQKIYKEGYFIEWTEERLLIFKKNINVEITTINSIIEDALRYNIFEESLFKKYKILTSSGIQKRFIIASDRRKMIELNKNYILVDITEVNDNINWVNDNNKPQRKGKKTKSKKSKEGPDFLTKIIAEFQSAYFEVFQIEYVIMNTGKERAAAGEILKLYKTKFPDQKSEETVSGLKLFFEKCCTVPDDWLQKNMSLSIIVSKFNEISKLIKNGKTVKSSASDLKSLTKLAELVGTRHGFGAVTVPG